MANITGTTLPSQTIMDGWGSWNFTTTDQAPGKHGFKARITDEVG